MSFRAPDKMQSGEYRLQTHRLPRPRFHFRPDAERGNRRPDCRQHGNHVNGGRTVRHRIQNSAKRRPQNRGCLKNRRVPRNRIREVFLRNQLRQNRPARRGVERPHHAYQHQDHINRSHRLQTALRDHEQRSETHGISSIASGEHVAALKVIRGMAGNREQQNSRQKLR